MQNFIFKLKAKMIECLKDRQDHRGPMLVRLCGGGQEAKISRVLKIFPFGFYNSGPTFLRCFIHEFIVFFIATASDSY